jgi:1-acyl-sn-glycerol-3-phosphate acyltransferase
MSITDRQEALLGASRTDTSAILKNKVGTFWQFDLFYWQFDIAILEVTKQSSLLLDQGSSIIYTEMDICYGLLKLILRIYISVCIRRVKVVGQENLVPGPKILVANHPNATDGFVLPFILPEKLHFLIQANMFSLPIIGFMLRKSGQIPMIKGQGRAALKTALERLSEGKTVVIFPEGKLNHGKKLHRAGAGAALLAKKSGALMVPIGFYVPPQDKLILKGKVQNRKTLGHWQVRGCCYVNVGKPWSVTKIAEDDLSQRKLRTITNRLMTQIADLVQVASEEAKRGKGKSSSSLAPTSPPYSGH